VISRALACFVTGLVLARTEAMLSMLVSFALTQAAVTPVVVELFPSTSCPQCERALASLQVPGVEIISLVQPDAASLQSGLVIDGRATLMSAARLQEEIITSAERGARPLLRLGVSRAGLTLTAQVQGVKARRVEVFLVEAGLVRARHVAGACDGEGSSCPLPSSTTRRVTHFELDPRWQTKDLAVVAVAREGEAGPVISSARSPL
jgi:hypothetical protein